MGQPGAAPVPLSPPKLFQLITPKPAYPASSKLVLIQESEFGQAPSRNASISPSTEEKLSLLLLAVK